MIERCRTIVFNEEVRNPGKSIRYQQRSQNEPRLPENGSRKQERPASQSSYGMKTARQRQTMR